MNSSNDTKSYNEIKLPQTVKTLHEICDIIKDMKSFDEVTKALENTDTQDIISSVGEIIQEIKDKKVSFITKMSNIKIIGSQKTLELVIRSTNIYFIMEYIRQKKNV